MKNNSKYFSHSILTADIKDKTVLEQPETDIIVGTYPCTKYSAIADIHGDSTGDDLFLHFFQTYRNCQTRNVYCRKCTRHEKIQSGYGSYDKATGLLCECVLPC